MKQKRERYLFLFRKKGFIDNAKIIICPVTVTHMVTRRPSVHHPSPGVYHHLKPLLKRIQRRWTTERDGELRHPKCSRDGRKRWRDKIIISRVLVLLKFRLKLRILKLFVFDYSYWTWKWEIIIRFRWGLERGVINFRPSQVKAWRCFSDFNVLSIL